MLKHKLHDTADRIQRWATYGKEEYAYHKRGEELLSHASKAACSAGKILRKCDSAYSAYLMRMPKEVCAVYEETAADHIAVHAYIAAIRDGAYPSEDERIEYRHKYDLEEGSMTALEECRCKELTKRLECLAKNCSSLVEVFVSKGEVLQ